jgi:hypothetical protein
MKLPNASLALVAKEKITEYLLNPAHPDTGGKAEFFHGLGFRREEWEVLARAFREVAVGAEVAERVESAHGMKYIIEGIMATPSGRAPRVRTIWIIDRGRNCPRLVTAYPAES